MDFAPQRHWAIPGNISACHNCEEVLLASSGQRPGMLLNILQCPGELSTTKNHPAQEVNSAEVLRGACRSCALLVF